MYIHTHCLRRVLVRAQSAKALKCNIVPHEVIPEPPATNGEKDSNVSLFAGGGATRGDYYERRVETRRGGAQGGLEG